jgi:hypothetical protein
MFADNQFDIASKQTSSSLQQIDSSVYVVRIAGRAVDATPTPKNHFASAAHSGCANFVEISSDAIPLRKFCEKFLGSFGTMSASDRENHMIYFGPLAITLGPFGNCEARELVKIKVENGTEWAIVGAKDPRYHPLVFLTGKNAAFVMNIDPEDPGDFAVVAKFGTNYRIAPDFTGPSQIGDDGLSKTTGSLVLTEKGDRYLVVRDATGLRWVELESGKSKRRPGLTQNSFCKVEFVD